MNSGTDLLPWDRRAELGTVRAFLQTLVPVVFEPGLFARLRGEGRVWDSLLFVVLSTLPVSLVLALLPILFHLNALTWKTVGVGAVGLLAVPLGFVVMTLVGAALDQLLLSLLYSTRSYRVTLRAHALSHASWVVGWLPFLGQYLALVGVLVTRARAYRGLHRVYWAPALLAALFVPLLSLCLLGVTGLFLLMDLGIIHD